MKWCKKKIKCVAHFVLSWSEIEYLYMGFLCFGRSFFLSVHVFGGIIKKKQQLQQNIIMQQTSDRRYNQ